MPLPLRNSNRGQYKKIYSNMLKKFECFELRMSQGPVYYKGPPPSICRQHFY